MGDVLRELVIDGTRIADDEPCYVIAEIGHNHQGSVETCKKLFDAAKDSGANAVKLQKRDNKTLYSPEFYNAPYNSENAFGPTYGQHREALEFDRAQYQELIAYAKGIGITLFATAFDIRSADFLAELGMPAFKIASGDLTNLELLAHVATFEKPVILSTGGGDAADVCEAGDLLRTRTECALLHCTSGYPAKYNELNLRAIDAYRGMFERQVIGWSAHDTGIAMAVAAYTLGARIIEKHFTLNRTMKGTDHAFSLEPHGLKKMVRDLKRAHVALGDGIKKRYESENKFLLKQEKHLQPSGLWQVDGVPA